MMRRLWSILSTVPAWIPVVAYAVLLTFAAISWSRFGNWPHYGAPDPKELDLPVLYASSALGVLLSHLCFVVGVPILIATAGTWQRARALVGLVVVVALLHCFPLLWPSEISPFRSGPNRVAFSLGTVAFLAAFGSVRVGLVVSLAAMIQQRGRRTLPMMAFAGGALLWTYESMRQQHLFVWLID